jgi:predicted RNase H-like nuclease (RuvC/YqgF family)
MCTQKCKLNYFARPSPKILQITQKLKAAIKTCNNNEENYVCLLEGRLKDELVEQCKVCDNLKLKKMVCLSCQEPTNVQVRIQGEENKEDEDDEKVKASTDVEKENKVLKMKLEALQMEISSQKQELDRIKTSSGHICKGCFATVKKAQEMKKKWNRCEKCEQPYCQKCSLFNVHTTNCCSKVLCNNCSVKIIGCEEHAKKFEQ